MHVVYTIYCNYVILFNLYYLLNGLVDNKFRLHQRIINYIDEMKCMLFDSSLVEVVGYKASNLQGEDYGKLVFIAFFNYKIKIMFYFDYDLYKFIFIVYLS